MFTTTALLGHEYLVSEGDKRALLDGTQFDALNHLTKVDDAEQAFDDALRLHMADINAAADAFDAAVNVEEDTDTYVVLTEKVDGVEAVEEKRMKLSIDTIILRTLAADPNSDRVIWIGNDRLGVRAA